MGKEKKQVITITLTGHDATTYKALEKSFSKSFKNLATENKSSYTIENLNNSIFIAGLKALAKHMLTGIIKDLYGNTENS